MNTSQIIARAKSLAEAFVGQGRDEVRLPVFDYEDWRVIYRKPAQGSSLSEWREQARLNWYLMHFLRGMNAEVTPVPVRAETFQTWAAVGRHDLADGHELAHAVGEYVNDPLVLPAACRHSDPEDGVALGQGPPLATLTVFGENGEEPEAMAAAVHRPDGQVLASLEVLAAEHSPQEAWEQVDRFLKRWQPAKVFHDQTVRRPEFCTDCNSLLLSIASAADIEAAADK
ncbi:MAG: hypothetical protein V1797_14515 [Pseudomonadota bacterium]